MYIVADNTIPYLKGVIESFGEVRYLSSGEFTAAAVRDADVLIVRSVDKCTREILEGSRVKLITTATIGFDHIDTAYCDEAGIVWKNAPGSNARSVAQYVLASLMTLSLRTGESLKGKTIGIVGVGHVGKEVEALCGLAGMHVLRNDPPRAELEGDSGFVSLQTIAREADIVTFHTPLTHQGNYPTYHLANRTLIDRFKRKPWFINTCRGAVHETDALLAGVQGGKISSLILDCWENEPNISRELLDHTTIATPHIAGFSADGKANATRMCLEEISRFFDVKINGIEKVIPPSPLSPVIDLNDFSSARIDHAVLHSFNPLVIDRMLREEPAKFEWFRANYSHPRQFEAYAVVHATPEEAVCLRSFGFQIA